MVLCGKPANKCGWERRKSPPGDRSVLSQRRRPSEYAMQLKEKQKARFMYGIVEKQEQVDEEDAAMEVAAVTETMLLNKYTDKNGMQELNNNFM